MHINVIANRYSVCSARYMMDAFRRLGHTVGIAGIDMDTRIWGLTLPKHCRWGWAQQGEFDKDNAELQIVMDSALEILDDIAPRYTRRDIPLICYGVDNHVRDYRRDYFQRYFVAHRDVSLMDWRDDMEHLPCAYDPAVFTPSAIPWEEREYDVAMLGVMYPDRWRVVEQLRAVGLKVIAGTGLVYENYAAVYQNARISLCISSNGDAAQRLFETAACGCAVLTDDIADFKHLKPDGFYIVDGDDWIGAALDVLGNPASAKAAIARSLAWVREHTWDKRAERIIEWYNSRNALTSI